MFFDINISMNNLNYPTSLLSSFIVATIFTLLVLFIYQALSINVSRLRFKNKIAVPKTAGNENFEIAQRMHLNFLENLVVFLPLLWIFSFLGQNIFWVIAFGLAWNIGRILFSIGYSIKNNALRIAGNALALTSIILVFGKIVHWLALIISYYYR